MLGCCNKKCLNIDNANYLAKGDCPGHISLKIVTFLHSIFQKKIWLIWRAGEITICLTKTEWVRVCLFCCSRDQVGKGTCQSDLFRQRKFSMSCHIVKIFLLFFQQYGFLLLFSFYIRVIQAMYSLYIRTLFAD